MTRALDMILWGMVVCGALLISGCSRGDEAAPAAFPNQTCKTETWWDRGLGRDVIETTCKATNP